MTTTQYIHNGSIIEVRDGKEYVVGSVGKKRTRIQPPTPAAIAEASIAGQIRKAIGAVA